MSVTDVAVYCEAVCHGDVFCEIACWLVIGLTALLIFFGMLYVAMWLLGKIAFSIAETADKKYQRRIKQMNVAGEKVTESKEEHIPKIEGMEESKEELIAKLDKRLINGEISEETYKQIIDRIKSMSEANKSKEREMEPKTEVE